jgi:hypothetical protein
LLNRYTVKSRIEGSNPSVSASCLRKIVRGGAPVNPWSGGVASPNSDIWRWLSGQMMRGLVVFALLCLASTQAFACMYDSDCERGNMCLDGTCVRDMLSGSDEAPVKRSPPNGKTCSYDGDCDPGSRCIKGSGPEGVCLGH